MKKITQSGFTLLELMVVIAMMGVLMAVGIPTFTSMMETSELSDTANELVLSLRKARAEAIVSGRDAVVCSSIDESSCSNVADKWNKGWLIMVDRNFDGNYKESDGELVWVKQLKSNTRITIKGSPDTGTVGATADFTDKVVFSYTGEIKSGKSGDFHVCSGATGSGYLQREISVTVGGEATLFKNPATKC